MIRIMTILLVQTFLLSNIGFAEYKNIAVKTILTKPGASDLTEAMKKQTKINSEKGKHFDTKQKTAKKKKDQKGRKRTIQNDKKKKPAEIKKKTNKPKPETSEFWNDFKIFVNDLLWGVLTPISLGVVLGLCFGYGWIFGVVLHFGYCIGIGIGTFIVAASIYLIIRSGITAGINKGLKANKKEIKKLKKQQKEYLTKKQILKKISEEKNRSLRYAEAINKEKDDNYQKEIEKLKNQQEKYLTEQNISDNFVKQIDFYKQIKEQENNADKKAIEIDEVKKQIKKMKKKQEQSSIINKRKMDIEQKKIDEKIDSINKLKEELDIFKNYYEKEPLIRFDTSNVVKQESDRINKKIRKIQKNKLEDIYEIKNDINKIKNDLNQLREYMEKKIFNLMEGVTENQLNIESNEKEIDKRKLIISKQNNSSNYHLSPLSKNINKTLKQKSKNLVVLQDNIPLIQIKKGRDDILSYSVGNMFYCTSDDMAIKTNINFKRPSDKACVDKLIEQINYLNNKDMFFDKPKGYLWQIKLKSDISSRQSKASLGRYDFDANSKEESNGIINLCSVLFADYVEKGNKKSYAELFENVSRKVLLKEMLVRTNQQENKDTFEENLRVFLNECNFKDNIQDIISKDSGKEALIKVYTFYLYEKYFMKKGQEQSLWEAYRNSLNYLYSEGILKDEFKEGNETILNEMSKGGVKELATLLKDKVIRITELETMA